MSVLPKLGPQERSFSEFRQTMEAQYGKNHVDEALQNCTAKDWRIKKPVFTYNPDAILFNDLKVTLEEAIMNYIPSCTSTPSMPQNIKPLNSNPLPSTSAKQIISSPKKCSKITEVVPLGPPKDSFSEFRQAMKDQYGKNHVSEALNNCSILEWKRKKRLYITNPDTILSTDLRAQLEKAIMNYTVPCASTPILDEYAREIYNTPTSTPSPDKSTQKVYYFRSNDYYL